MFSSSRFKLIATFFLVLIFVVGLALRGSIRLTAHAASITSKLTVNPKTTTKATASCGAWSVISSPNLGYSVLQGVTAISSRNVWAVGYYIDTGAQALIEHWNGKNWSVVSSPNIGGYSSSLSGIARVPGTNELWAVGTYSNSSDTFPFQTLIEHWEGTSWTVVSSPSPGLQYNDLFGVVANSPSDVWAVGFASNGTGTSQTLIEHWDGTSWSLVSSPNLGPNFNYLYQVAAISIKNIWAVGYASSGTATFQTLIEHWNGKRWHIISSPNPGVSNNFLTSISRVPGTDQLWAVGADSNDTSTSQTLVEHWDGSSWSVVSSPNLGPNVDSLNQVVAISVSNVWAVGVDSNSPGTSQSFTEHWDGTSWSVVSSPNPGVTNTTLYGIARVPGTNDLWVVGVYDTSSSTSQALIEYYC